MPRDEPGESECRVRSYLLFTKVQFIGYEINTPPRGPPGRPFRLWHEANNPDNEQYVGDPDDDADIRARTKIMSDAIHQAYRERPASRR
jgi:hypothetical protein